MASTKQLAANRRNAHLSTGPISPAGKRRSAINARRHGLTTPIELSEHAQHLAGIASMIQAEGHEAHLSMNLAKCILDFERNVQHMQTLICTDAVGVLPSVDSSETVRQERIMLEEVNAKITEKVVYRSRQFNFLLNATAQLHRSLIKRHISNAAKNWGYADRHYRRAANQLLKKLRNLQTAS